jgi:hypothetical protein
MKQKFKNRKIAAVIVLWLIAVLPPCLAQAPDSVTSAPKPSMLVVAAKALSKHRPKGKAIIGDNLEIVVRNLKVHLDSIPKDSIVKMSLVINGLPCPDLTSSNIDIDKETVIFWLDTASVSLNMLKQRLVSQWDKEVACTLSVCLKGETAKTNLHSFGILFITPKLLLHVVFVFALVFAILYILATQTNFMRVGKDGSPFSLSQFQLTFWTVVIAVSVVYIWILTDILPDLPGSVLTLLGISAATSVSSKFVSMNIRKDTPITARSSEGFFKDVLSDDYSTNIQRFQMFAWTLILGVIFLLKVLYRRQLFDFDESYLVLTGISAGAYTLLKYTENKAPETKGEQPANDAPVPPVG